ncbi:hypothetical protein THAOC_20539, partial [Thalassiosira oceanica]
AAAASAPGRLTEEERPLRLDVDPRRQRRPSAAGMTEASLAQNSRRVGHVPPPPGERARGGAALVLWTLSFSPRDDGASVDSRDDIVFLPAGFSDE